MQHSVVMAFMDTILQYSALVSFTFSTWKCKSSLKIQKHDDGCVYGNTRS